MRLQVSRSDVTISQWLTALICGVSLCAPGALHAQTTLPQASETRASSPAYEASRQAFEALSESDRRAVQEALVWVGAYSSTVGGVFGIRTYDGIVAYQQRINAPADGILNTSAMAELKAAAAKARAAVGFAVVRDRKTGMDIGVPMRLLSKQSVNANGGNRWQSPDDKITLDTRRISPGETDLQSYYQRVLAVQSPGRKVTYKIIRPDFFVVTGETQTGKFYTRYAAGPDGLRGFSLGYDKSLAATFDRVVIAISNSFTPFPEIAPPVAASIDASGQGSSSSQDVARMPASIGGSTGIRIGARHVVAVAPGCNQPKVDGNAAKVARRDEGLVLLVVSGGAELAALPLRTGPLPAGASIIVVSWGAGDGNLVTTGTVEGENSFSAPLQAGATGGLVFDRTGAVVGLVGAALTRPRSVSGILTPTSYAITPVNVVRNFVGADGVFTDAATDGTGAGTAEIAASVSGRFVNVICGDAK